VLAPKKVKYRKVQKGRMRGKAYRGGEVAFGEFGLKVLEPGRITARQIEAARIAMTVSPFFILVFLFMLAGISHSFQRRPK